MDSNSKKKVITISYRCYTFWTAINKNYTAWSCLTLRSHIRSHVQGRGYINPLFSQRVSNLIGLKTRKKSITTQLYVSNFLFERISKRIFRLLALTQFINRQSISALLCCLNTQYFRNPNTIIYTFILQYGIRVFLFDLEVVFHGSQEIK